MWYGFCGGSHGFREEGHNTCSSGGLRTWESQSSDTKPQRMDIVVGRVCRLTSSTTEIVLHHTTSPQTSKWHKNHTWNWFPHFTVKGVSLITCGCFALLHRLLLFLQHWCDHIIETDYSKLYSFKNKANIGLAVEVLPYFYPLSKLSLTAAPS